MILSNRLYKFFGNGRYGIGNMPNWILCRAGEAIELWTEIEIENSIRIRLSL